MSQAQLKRVFGGCLDAITSLEVYVPAEDGSLMSRQRCELFNALPNKKVGCVLDFDYYRVLNVFLQAYADYYNVIHQPISLTQIKGKVSKSNYRSAEAFRDDLRLMFGNARLYNQDTSEVYQDANEMQKVFESTYARLMAGGVVEDNSGLTPSGSGSGALTPMEVEEPRRRSKSRRNKVVSSDDDEEWNEDD
jgi:ATP-dependent helicase STH1/SNF2